METGFYRPPDRSKYLLADEIEKLLKAAKKEGEGEGRFLTFMANTGVRPSEAGQVRASDVHAAESRVRVATLKQKDDRKIFRDVDLSPPYAKELGTLSKAVEKDSLLFPFSRFTSWRIFKRVARAAKLQGKYTLYSLRHSRAIYLLEWTGDLQYVSKQMGHSNISVTMAYLHCLPSKRTEYVQSKLKAFGV